MVCRIRLEGLSWKLQKLLSDFLVFSQTLLCFQKLFALILGHSCFGRPRVGLRSQGKTWCNEEHLCPQLAPLCQTKSIVCSIVLATGPPRSRAGMGAGMLRGIGLSLLDNRVSRVQSCKVWKCPSLKFSKTQNLQSFGAPEFQNSQNRHSDIAEMEHMCSNK